MTWLTGTAARALPSRETWRQEAARLADERQVWTGLSGAIFTGREVADHITAAVRHLERNGWDPHDLHTSRRVGMALLDTAPGGAGDHDARGVAMRLLDLLVHVHAGSRGPWSFGAFEAWEGRAGRTLGGDVKDLLMTAAQFAREHGPQGGGRRG